MKTFLAFIGGAVLVLFLAGASGIGHFQLHYTPKPLKCAKVMT